MKTVEVYVNGAGQPQHLAVLDEKPGETESYRAVCGADTGEQGVKKLQPNDVKFGCGTCNDQLKMWEEVHS